MNIEEQIKFIEDNYPFYKSIHSKRQIRHDFFKNISTEIQAYLLGFFVADGSINEKRKTLRVLLKSNDDEICKLYRDFISPNAYFIYTKEHLTTGRNNQIVHANQSCKCDISSSILCNDLVDLGFGYNKTYSELHLPKIKENLIRHFIRGYFDGDGSFCISITKPKNRPSIRLRTYFTICAKTSTLLNDILRFFSNHDIKTNVCFAKRDQMYMLETSDRNECKKIYHLLYDDSNFYLKRKFNKFNYYANTEITQIISEYCNALAMSVNESNNLPKSVEYPGTDKNVR